MRVRILCVLAIGLAFASTARAALVSHYTFDSGYSDSGTVGNNGSLVGSGGIVSAASPDGSSGFLSLSGGYVDLPGAGENWWSQATIAAWVKLDSNSDTGNGYSTIYSQDWWDPHGSGTIHITQNDGPNSSVWVGNYVNLETAVGAPPTGWYHMAWVYHGGGANDELYINGQLATSAWHAWSAWPGTALKDMAGPAAIGAYGGDGSHALHGEIDDFRIYNTALSASEIATLATPVNTPEPGTFVLAGTGLLGLLADAWRKRK